MYKRQVLRLVERINLAGKTVPIPDIAASFERVVAEVLVERTIKCAEDHSLENVVVVGGVAANNTLRKMMISEASKKSIKVHLAPLNLCTDNAAMIGAAALRPLKEKSYLRNPPFLSEILHFGKLNFIGSPFLAIFSIAGPPG